MPLRTQNVSVFNTLYLPKVMHTFDPRCQEFQASPDCPERTLLQYQKKEAKLPKHIYHSLNLT